MTANVAFTDEGRLFSYLDEYLNANGAEPHVAGLDAHGRPFMAWLDEEGGDCVGLRICVLLNMDGATESPSIVEAPEPGMPTSLGYPVTILDPSS